MRREQPSSFHRELRNTCAHQERASIRRAAAPRFACCLPFRSASSQPPSRHPPASGLTAYLAEREVHRSAYRDFEISICLARKVPSAWQTRNEEIRSIGKFFFGARPRQQLPDS